MSDPITPEQAEKLIHHVMDARRCMETLRQPPANSTVRGLIDGSLALLAEVERLREADRKGVEYTTWIRQRLTAAEARIAAASGVVNHLEAAWPLMTDRERSGFIAGVVLDLRTALTTTGQEQGK